jgi:hypothetical protein
MKAAIDRKDGRKLGAAKESFPVADASIKGVFPISAPAPWVAAGAWIFPSSSTGMRWRAGSGSAGVAFPTWLIALEVVVVVGLEVVVVVGLEVVEVVVVVGLEVVLVSGQSHSGQSGPPQHIHSSDQGMIQNGSNSISVQP